MADNRDTFEAEAKATIEGLFDAIDGAVGDVVDVDLQEGILTLELENGGQYVINSHAPNRQIWLSSPVSGAAHFNQGADPGQWVGSRGEGRLNDILAGELGDATGATVTLD